MRREGRPCGFAAQKKRNRKAVCRSLCRGNGVEKPSAVRCAEKKSRKAARRMPRRRGFGASGLSRVGSTAFFTPPEKRGGAFAALAHCLRRAVTCRTDRFLCRAVTRAGARDHRKTETICRIKPLYHTAPGKSRRDRPHVFAEAAANDRPHAKKRPKSIFSGRFLFLLCFLYLLLLFNFNLLFFVKNRSFLHAFYDFNPL